MLTPNNRPSSGKSVLSNKPPAPVSQTSGTLASSSAQPVSANEGNSRSGFRPPTSPKPRTSVDGWLVRDSAKQAYQAAPAKLLNGPSSNNMIEQGNLVANADSIGVEMLNSAALLERAAYKEKTGNGDGSGVPVAVHEILHESQEGYRMPKERQSPDESIEEGNERSQITGDNSQPNSMKYSESHETGENDNSKEFSLQHNVGDSLLAIELEKSRSQILVLQEEIILLNSKISEAEVLSEQVGWENQRSRRQIMEQNARIEKVEMEKQTDRARAEALVDNLKALNFQDLVNASAISSILVAREQLADFEDMEKRCHLTNTHLNDIEIAIKADWGAQESELQRLVADLTLAEQELTTQRQQAVISAAETLKKEEAFRIQSLDMKAAFDKEREAGHVEKAQLGAEITSLQEKCRNLDIQIKESSKQQATLQASTNEKISALETKKQAAERQIQEMQLKVEKADASISSLKESQQIFVKEIGVQKDENNRLKKVVQDLENLNSGLQQNLDSFLSKGQLESQNYATEIRWKEAEREQLSLQLKSTTQDLEKSKAEHEDLRTQIEKLETSMNDAQTAKMQLEEKLTAAEVLKDSAQAEAQALKSEIELLQRQLKTALEMCEEKTAEAKSTGKEDLSTRLQQLASENESLKAEANELSQRLERSHSQNYASNQEKDTKLRKEFAKSIDLVKADFRTESLKKDRQVQELILKVTDFAEHLKTVDRNFEDIAGFAARSGQEKNEFSQRIKELWENLQQAETPATVDNDAENGQQDRIRDLNIQIAELSSENAKLLLEKEKETDAHKSSISQIEELTRKGKADNQKMAEFSNIVEQLTALGKKEAIRLEKMAAYVKTLEDEKAQLTRRCEDLSNDLKENTSRLEALAAQQQAELSEKQALHQNADKLSTDLKNALDEKANANYLLERLGAEVMLGEDERKKLAETIDEMKNAIEQLRSQALSDAEVHKVFQAEKRALQNQVEEMHRKHTQERIALHSKLQDANSRLALAAEALSNAGKKSTEISNLENELTEAFRERDDLRARLGAYDARTAHFQLRNQQLEAQVNRVAQDASGQAVNLERMGERVQSYERALFDTRQSIALKDARIAELESNVLRLSQLLNRSKRENDLHSSSRSAGPSEERYDPSMLRASNESILRKSTQSSAPPPPPPAMEDDNQEVMAFDIPQVRVPPLHYESQFL